MMSSRYPNLPSSIPDDWTSPDGLAILNTLVSPCLPFEPRDFQLYDSACILNGQDVFCISATGDGKSALIYIPALVRPNTITIVVEPTNFLEETMAENLREKGLLSVVINGDTLLKAARKGCNLWEEARACKYRIITLSPESLRSPEFSAMINNPYFRSLWRVLAVDEAHLTDEWGDNFRPLYEDIWSLRPRGPEHLTVVTLSASVEPGKQTHRILGHLGFTEGTYHLDRRDCERRNVDLIFRNVQYPYSGYEFRDLDWLIPTNMEQTCDMPKRVVYCDTIELGHRVASYLRSLLPARLRAKSHTLVRHLHSMNCPECKKDSLSALYATAGERTTVLFVSTAVMDVGIDAPDIDEVVIYPSPSSASSTIQRAGRPARRAGMQGKAIIYVKKADLEAAKAYVDTVPTDTRLVTQKVGRIVRDLTSGLGEVETSGGATDSEDVEMRSAESVDDQRHCEPGATDGATRECTDMDVDETTVNKDSTTAGSSTGRGKRNSKHALAPRCTASKAGTKDNSSLLLLIAAHAHDVSITRQANMVYGNPGVDLNCGRCSSCVRDTVPEPRPQAASVNEVADPNQIEDKTPQWQRLTHSDKVEAASLLRSAILDIYFDTSPSRPETLLFDDTCFVTDGNLNAITHDFHLLISKALLQERMEAQHWRYWETSGDSLWGAVDSIRSSMCRKLELRHEERQEKRRAAAVHKDLVKKGLTGIKKVKLVLGTVNRERTALPGSTMNSDNLGTTAGAGSKRLGEDPADERPHKISRLDRKDNTKVPSKRNTLSTDLAENTSIDTSGNTGDGRRRSTRLRGH